MNKLIIEAIENQNVIEFNYEGTLREVEPHRYGKTTAGNEALRAYQVGGYSSSGKMGWKMYDLRKAENINILEITFDVRGDYSKGDKGMSQIHMEI
ncbi:hypothetical protein ACTJKC_14820 [Pedobacter sp. 22226]|uniref:hypothetical protein n=1 Tax=Pedobacter sp. 22226 TaxID=3453894 RepID=UPI003F86C063